LKFLYGNNDENGITPNPNKSQFIYLANKRNKTL